MAGSVRLWLFRQVEGFPPELLAELRAVDPRPSLSSRVGPSLSSELPLAGCWLKALA